MAGQNINTYIFYDLEGTGLTGPGQVPRITEISLVAVHRMSLLSTDTMSNGLPRTLDTLTLCVCPRKPVPAFISDMTGLHNDMLMYYSDFNANTADMINMFIEQHEKPICLVAHNGTGYDFGLLKAEYASVGKCLPEDLLCADSLKMFKALDAVNDNNNKPKTPFHEQNQQLTPAKKDSIASDSVSSPSKVPAVKRKLFTGNGNSDEPVLNDEHSLNSKKPLIAVNDGSATCPTNTKSEIKAEDTLHQCVTMLEGNVTQNKPNYWEIMKTGESLEDHLLCSIDMPVEELSGDGSEPESERKDSSCGNGGPNKVKASDSSPTRHQNDPLPENTDDKFSNGQIIEKNLQNTEKETTVSANSAIVSNLSVQSNLPRTPQRSGTPPRFSYKLREIHKRVIGFYPAESHRAEDDAIALVRIFHKLPTQVSSWADNNAVKLDSIPPAFVNQKRLPLPKGIFPYCYTGKK